jgi:hypothetical protein
VRAVPAGAFRVVRGTREIEIKAGSIQIPRVFPCSIPGDNQPIRSAGSIGPGDGVRLLSLPGIPFDILRAHPLRAAFK